MIEPLKYYFLIEKLIVLVIFNRYTIDTNGVIVNKETGTTPTTHVNTDGYNVCSVYEDSGKQRHIRVCRAIASTFIGAPPSPDHTADHKDRNPANDTFDNIRWLDRTGQNRNQYRSDTLQTAFIIINDGVVGVEKNITGWVEHLKDDKNTFGREYTIGMINHYAQKKQHGFSYKKYIDLEGEVWKVIIGSENTKGRWEISNMNRVKYITKHAENVLSGERLCMHNGYPKIHMNGKSWYCHILAFKTFFPEEYAAKKPCEIVLHTGDDRLDFRPHKLRLGTRSQNAIDAHDNGCYVGTLKARKKCISYVKGVIEKVHASQSNAVKYLKYIGFEKASRTSIIMVLNGIRKTAYGRTWTLI